VNFSELLSSTAFWLCVSIAAYTAGQWLQRKTHSPICNPLLIATVLVGALMIATGTSSRMYNERGGAVITAFVMPSTVALAVPIYRQIAILKANWLPVLVGALVGSLTSIVSVIGFSRLFGLSDTTLRSLIPKSVTSPIAISLSEMLGGFSSITAVAVVFTGIVGAIVLPPLLKRLGVQDPVQVGLSMGTAAHAVGTSRAIELGEVEGAVSGLAIGIAGLLTSLLVSIGAAFLG